MNAHTPLNPDHRSQLMLGALNLTECDPDPVKEFRRAINERALVNIDLLADALTTLRKETANAAMVGRKVDEQALMLVCVAFQDIAYTDELETQISAMADRLGLNDDSDDSFREQVRLDYEAGRL